MIRKWFTPRVLLGAASIALIVFALSQMISVRTPNRPWGSAEDIRGLADRDDLNLVFVLVDTLRADRLSAYGYERETSPILEKLAETGIRFDHTLSQSTWTKASMASMWTSTYPTTNRITRYPHGLPDAFQSPAETMQAAGFRTVGIFRNGWVAPNFGFSQGFDLYYLPRVLARPANVEQKNPSAAQLLGTDHDLTNAAVEFLRSGGREGRFLLYLHLMDVHQYVYDDSVQFGTSFSDIYDNSIRWVDANIGTLVAILQEQELMERTVLVIASDHGEAFHEHGVEGHARDLYVETTRVPWVIALPFRLEKPIVVETPVENIDIWPTLLDLLGLPPLENAEGHSLVPLIEAAARGDEQSVAIPDDRRVAFLDQTWGQQNADPKPLIALHDGRYRLFRQLTPDGHAELYDAEADPGEQHDISADDPETVARLEAEAREYLKVPEPAWGRPVQVPLSDMELGQLRALGYMVGHDDDAHDDGEGDGGAEAAPPEGDPGGAVE